MRVSKTLYIVKDDQSFGKLWLDAIGESVVLALMPSIVVKIRERGESAEVHQPYQD